MSHSISRELTPEIIELRMEEKIYLSFCPRDKIPTIGYAMVFLVISSSEENSIHEYKEKMNIFGRDLFNSSGLEKLQHFTSFGQELFRKRTNRKIILVGKSAVGKTSIKKFFFESASAEHLLNSPIEPTYGLVHYTYEWMDLDLGIADLAGQEIEQFLDGTYFTDLDPFDQVDLVLYVFDPHYWRDNSKLIVEHIEKIQGIVQKKKIDAKIYVFCHKIDLIDEKAFSSFKNEIMYTLPEEVQDHLIFTSIHSKYLHQLVRGMQKVIGTMSPHTNDMEEVIYESIKALTKTSVIIFKKNFILLQVSSEDATFINFQILKEFIVMAKSLVEQFGKKQFELTIKGLSFCISYGFLNLIEDEQILIISENLVEKEIKKLRDSIQYSLLFLDTDLQNDD